jgi:N-acetylglucosaminyldiphosphoundecaprenol N-acetyl-beta-D-mannosaminyltransferase
VLGVPVDVVRESDVLRFVRDRVSTAVPARIVTVNTEFVILARRNAAFRRALATADLATPDGAGVVWAMRRAGVDQQGRVGGSDLIWSISSQAATLEHGVFLLGAAEGVAMAAARTLQARFPRLRVCGTLAGSPAPEDEARVVDSIRQSSADILFVAFGAPAQDIWIARNLRKTGVAVAIGVGGSFDYVAGRVRRAPRWMGDRGLEWLWRLIQQPWRWRRMVALPVFVFLVMSGGRRSMNGHVRER